MQTHRTQRRTTRTTPRHVDWPSSARRGLWAFPRGNVTRSAHRRDDVSFWPAVTAGGQPALTTRTNTLAVSLAWPGRPLLLPLPGLTLGPTPGPKPGPRATSRHRKTSGCRPAASLSHPGCERPTAEQRPAAPRSAPACPADPDASLLREKKAAPCDPSATPRLLPCASDLTSCHTAEEWCRHAVVTKIARRFKAAGRRQPGATTSRPKPAPRRSSLSARG